MELDVRVYGADECPSTLRIRQHLSSRGIPYTYVNLDKDEDAERKTREWNDGRRITPTVVLCGNGCTERLAQPQIEELEAAIARFYGVDSAA